jgi:hypothetical protein
MTGIKPARRPIIKITLLILLTVLFTIIFQANVDKEGRGQTFQDWYPSSLPFADSSVVLVTAVDSSPVLQSNNAVFHCAGKDDQNQIEVAINSLPKTGGMVVLAAGTYQCSDDLHLNQRVKLIGMGEERTLLHFSAPADLVVREHDEVRDLKITGSTSLFIVESHVKIENVTMTVDQSKAAAFYVYADNRSLEDFSFQNCSALNCGTHGFMNNGEGEQSRISYIRYSNCRAVNAGLNTRYDPWTTGFDLTELVDLEHCRVYNCTAEGSWESGFHIEESPKKVDVVLENCVSLRNGQKQSVTPPKFGAGFLLSGDTQAINCTSDGNYNGYLCFTGARLLKCCDRGSEIAYDIVDHSDVTIQNCRSVLAHGRALNVINASDVIIEEFTVVNPGRNTDPIIELGSTTTLIEKISLNCSVDCAGTGRQIRIINGIEIILSGDIKTAADHAISIEGASTVGIIFSDLLILSSAQSSDSTGVQISSDVVNAHTVRFVQGLIASTPPSQGLAFGVNNRASGPMKVQGVLTSDVAVPFNNCYVPKGAGPSFVYYG